MLDKHLCVFVFHIYKHVYSRWNWRSAQGVLSYFEQYFVAAQILNAGRISVYSENVLPSNTVRLCSLPAVHSIGWQHITVMQVTSSSSDILYNLQ